MGEVVERPASPAVRNWLLTGLRRACLALAAAAIAAGCGSVTSGPKSGIPAGAVERPRVTSPSTTDLGAPISAPSSSATSDTDEAIRMPTTPLQVPALSRPDCEALNSTEASPSATIDGLVVVGEAPSLVAAREYSSTERIPDDPPFFPSASKDGRRISYVTEAGPDSAVWTSADGRTTKVFEAAHVGGVSTSDDGVLIAVATGEGVVVFTTHGVEMSRIAAPLPGSIVLGLAWSGESDIVAVVDAPAAGVSTEFAGNQNLFVLNLDSGSWRQVTSFATDAGTWTAVMTPVVAGGVVWFVVQRGLSSGGLDDVVTELWQVEPGEEPRPVRGVPPTVFLAGTADGRMVWDFSEEFGTRLLGVEQNGQLRVVACGSVLARPVTLPRHSNGG